jgi:agmatinase
MVGLGHRLLNGPGPGQGACAMLRRVAGVSKPLHEVVEELERGLPPAPGAGFLGAELDPAEARLVLLAVPWEVTTSYGGGTSAGPAAMVAASHQLDLEDGAFGQPYRAGIACLPQDPTIVALNASARPAARRAIAALERGAEAAVDRAAVDRAVVNAAGAELNAWVYAAAREVLERGQRVGLVGGDHSCPFGLIRALAQRQDFGILHLDAHHDLRAAYEGFTWSHASVFYNVMENISQVSRLVQVGVRDYSRGERRYLESLGGRAKAFYGRDLFRLQAEGEGFASIAHRILAGLPERVYLSFDIDALDPPYCPSTGTPVPGGLSFDQAGYLLEELASSGRRVVGFDLCEVVPGADGREWDANVGARVLYRLCGCLLRSQSLC